MTYPPKESEKIECSLPNSTFAQELEQVSPPLVSLPGDLTSSDCVTSSQTESMDTSEISCSNDFLTSPSSTMSEREVIGNGGESAHQMLSPLLPPVRPSLSRESAWEQTTQEIAFQQSWTRSPSSNQSLQSLKTSQACSPARLDRGNHQVHISETCSESLTAAGMMRNGFVFPAPTLKRPGLEKGYCWLPRPGALSNNLAKSRPPGTSKFEGKCKQLGLLAKNQVANPEFLEAAFGLPIGWTDPLELRAATQLLGSGGKHLEIALTRDLPQLPSDASSISTVSLSDNSVADTSDMVTSNSTLTAPSGDRAVPTKSTRVRKTDLDTPHDESSLAKAEAVRVEVLEELDEDEERDRHRLERKVESAFREAALALKELRDRRLYRSTHKTFEEYCRNRFGFSRSRSYQLIDAAVVVEDLEKCPQFVDILPTNEAQCRPLLDLKSSDRFLVWSAVAESGQRPTGANVKQKVAQLEAQGIVERLKAKSIVLAKQFCQVGDVFTLVRLEGKEKKYNGCWAIVTEPRDFTVIVDVHDTTLTVKPENLNKIDDPEAHRQLPQILQRLGRVRGVAGFSDRAAYMMLEHLGKQTYLTPLENKLLQVIEREYGVEDANSEVGS